MTEFDPVFLSRIQFAFTISFHILFPAFTIGLASWLAVLEGLWLKTGNNHYKEIYKFWIKIFAVTFGMGVVSGVVLSYQIGTNWSAFSDKVGNILGPLLSFEVLAAFFLESSFLGIMLFGWDRVGRKVHFASTIIVALGTLISAFWILSANSWMHTPAGFSVSEAQFQPESWLQIIFNPSFPYRFLHMVNAAYITTGFVVAGVASWYLLNLRHAAQAKIMLSMAMLMAFIGAPLQLLFGDLHGLNTLEYQPAKIAAMEAVWETQTEAPFTVIGWPNEKTERTDYALEIPKLGSLILRHRMNGEVQGLKDWPKEERPPVAPVFFAFRIMVLIGILMILTGITSAFLYFKKLLFVYRPFLRWCVFMTPSGFIAVLCGWMVTEIGRQPYIVYNLIRTKDVVSPIAGQYVFISLMVFIVAYLFIFGAGIYYILKLIKKGPGVVKEEDIYGEHGIKHPVILNEIL